jgi:hypothetical protein
MTWRTIDDDIAQREYVATTAIPVWLTQNGGETGTLEACAPSGEMAWLDGSEPKWSSHPDQPGGFWTSIPFGRGATQLRLSIRYSTVTATAGGSFVVRFLGRTVEVVAPASVTPTSVDIDVDDIAPANWQLMAPLWIGWRSELGPLDTTVLPFIAFGSGTEVYYQSGAPLAAGKYHMLLTVAPMTDPYSGSSGGQRSYHVCSAEVVTTPGANGVLYVWPPLESQPNVIPTAYNPLKVVAPTAFQELGACILHGFAYASRVISQPIAPPAYNHQGMNPSSVSQLATLVRGNDSQTFDVMPVNIFTPEGFGYRGGGLSCTWLLYARVDLNTITLNISGCAINDGGQEAQVDVSILDVPAFTPLAFTTQTITFQAPPPAAIPLLNQSPGRVSLLPYNVRPEPALWGAADSVAVTDAYPTSTAITLTHRTMTAGNAYVVVLSINRDVWCGSTTITSNPP